MSLSPFFHFFLLFLFFDLIDRTLAETEVFPIVFTNSDLDKSDNCQSQLSGLPNEFYLNQIFWGFRDDVAVMNLDETTEYGRFYRKIFGVKSYRYADSKGNLLVFIEQKLFSLVIEYEVEPCRGSRYKLTEEFLTSLTSLNFQNRYEIYKDGSLLGHSNKWGFADFDINITLADGTPLAMLTRKWKESIFTDRWWVKNYKPDLIDNYLVGMLGALHTIKAKERRSNSRSSRYYGG